ncbi:hypothetical protein BOTBODRAFT_174371 [Botryobasidium botryosum FD-172 SS1]|uniref:Uncharacterized protein n=1 Tax=Botryobasidium botryosum (strain FD-172 SS1) TaxID=930990 RepID=A0A067MJI3_BOTB1|nr:hypothetical protein BOTBODRAFT_174371 [Botryobasidium botryosum FD-172 SS1]
MAPHPPIHMLVPMILSHSHGSRGRRQTSTHAFMAPASLTYPISHSQPASPTLPLPVLMIATRHSCLSFFPHESKGPISSACCLLARVTSNTPVLPSLVLSAARGFPLPSPVPHGYPPSLSKLVFSLPRGSCLVFSQLLSPRLPLSSSSPDP